MLVCDKCKAENNDTNDVDSYCCNLLMNDDSIYRYGIDLCDKCRPKWIDAVRELMNTFKYKKGS